MDCKDTSRGELAEKYLNGKLDDANQDAYEMHLLECPKCAQELEILQLVQTRLVEQAHEIRRWTPAKRHFFRWQVVVVAAGIVVAVATASMVMRRQKTHSASATTPPPRQANPPLSEKVAKENPPGKTVKIEKPQKVSSGAEKTQVAQTNLARRMDNLPTNGRNYVNFTILPSQPAPDVVPSIGPAPTSGSNVGGARARGTAVSVDGEDAVDNSVNAVRRKTQVAEENSKPTPALSDTQPKLELTTAQAVELYQLANAVPPTFTFSGFSNSKLLMAPGAPHSHARSKQNAETDRKIFREAMDAYIAGDYPSAGEVLEQAVLVEPNAADVQFYLGVCRLVNGHATDAVQPLRRAATTHNLTLRQRAHYYLAKAYLQSMNLGEAEDEFRVASELSGPLKADSSALLARVQTLRAQIGKN